MRPSGAETTKRRVRGRRIFWLGALPIVALAVPLAGSGASADPVSDTLCAVRGLANVLVEPCAKTSPEPQPSDQPQPTAAPTARPAARTLTPPSAARTTLVTTTSTTPGAEAPVQDGTIPPSQPEKPAPSGSGADTTDAAPAASSSARRSPFGIAEMIFVAAMSAGLAWVLAARRRRRLDAETDAAVSRIERLKTDILSMLAHELFTPLTPLLGYATMLRAGKISKAATRQIAERLIDASKQLERTIDLLVTFAAIRGGTRTLHRQRIDPAALAQSIAAEARTRNPGRSIHVALSLSTPALDGDADLIRAAIDQLVDNAVKFSSAGKPVTIGVHAGPSESETIEFVVTDQGNGIQPADLTAIFDSFHQVDGSSTRNAGGIGLGLAFVAAVAEMHGGTVEVDSRPGLGSAFTFRIRTAAAEQPVPVRSPASVAAIRHTAA